MECVLGGWVVGCVWVWGLGCVQHTGPDDLRRLRVRLRVCVCVCVCVC